MDYENPLAAAIAATPATAAAAAPASLPDRLGVSPDNPLLTSIYPEVAAQSVVNRSLASGRNFDQTAEELKRYGLNPDRDVDQAKLRPALDLAKAKRDVGSELPFGSGPISGTLAAFKKKYLPFNDVIPFDIPVGGDAPGAGRYSRAVERYKSGTYDDDDLRAIIKYEQQEKALGDMKGALDRSGTAGVLGRTILELGGVGKVIGEATTGAAAIGRFAPRLLGATAAGAAPAVPTAGRALASYLGTRVPLTLATPSLYVPMMQSNNLKNGRDANDWRGLPAAAAYGYGTMLVLGQLQKGVKPGMSDWLKKGAIGVGELQLVDAAATVVDRVLPKGFGTESEGGPIGKWLKARAEGKGDEADVVLGDTAIQMLVFGALAKAHGESPATLRDTYVSAVRDLQKAGASKKAAAEQIRGLHDTLGGALEAVPDLSREQAAGVLSQVDGVKADSPLGKYAVELIKAFNPNPNAVAKPKAAEPPQPQPGEPAGDGAQRGPVDTTATGATKLPAPPAERPVAPGPTKPGEAVADGTAGPRVSPRIVEALRTVETEILKKAVHDEAMNPSTNPADLVLVDAMVRELQARGVIPADQRQQVATVADTAKTPTTTPVEPQKQTANTPSEPAIAPPEQSPESGGQPAAPAAAEKPSGPERDVNIEVNKYVSEAVRDASRLTNNAPLRPDAAKGQIIQILMAGLQRAERSGDAALVSEFQGRLEANGVDRTGEAGEVVTYDPKAMDVVGGAKIGRGKQVELVEPGYASADGRVYTRAKVREYDPRMDSHLADSEKFPFHPRTRNEMKSLVRDNLAANDKLTDEQRADYSEAMGEAIDRMPDEVFEDVRQNVRGVKFFPTGGDALVAAYEQTVRDMQRAGSAELAETAAELKQIKQQIKDGTLQTAGCCMQARGTLYIDGGHAQNASPHAAAPARFADARASMAMVYLHEMSHLWAWRGGRDVTLVDPQWIQAYEKEIKGDQLGIGHYATMSPQEAFAELTCSLWGGRISPDRVRELAPRAAHWLERNSLMPDGAPADIGTSNGFTKRLKTGRKGEHIDVAAEPATVAARRPEPAPEAKPELKAAEPKAPADELADMRAGTPAAKDRAIEVLTDEYADPESDAASRDEIEGLAEAAGLNRDYAVGEELRFDPGTMQFAGQAPPADTAVVVTRAGWSGNGKAIKPVVSFKPDAAAREKIGSTADSRRRRKARQAEPAPAPAEPAAERRDSESEADFAERTFLQEQWDSADASERAMMLGDPATARLLNKHGIDTEAKAKRAQSGESETVADPDLAVALSRLPHLEGAAGDYIEFIVGKGRSVRETAEQFGVTPDAVRKTLGRAFQAVFDATTGKGGIRGVKIPTLKKILDRLTRADLVERTEAQRGRGEVTLGEGGRPVASVALPGQAPEPAGTGTRGRLRHWLTTVVGRLFRSRGNLTQSQYEAKKEEVDALLAKYAERSQTMVRDLDAAVSAATGGAAKTTRALNPAEARLLDDVLRGSESALEALASSRLGTDGVLMALAKMRREVDHLSIGLVRTGMLQDGMYLRFLKGIGTYMTRQFEAFDRPDWQRRVPQAAFDHAVQGVWGELKQLYKADGKPEPPLELATAYVESLLADTQSSARRTDVLKQREIIPEWLSDLWGEYRDPVANFVNTVGKQANLLAAFRFFNRIAHEGRGVTFFRNEDLAEYKRLFPNSGGAVEVTTPAAILKKPLEGFKTAPEIRDAIDTVFAKDAELPRAYQLVGALNYATKYAKTILSHPTIVTNFLSNWGKAVMNGHVGRGNFAAGVRALADDTPAGRQFRERLIELGVINDNVTAGEFKETFKEAMGDRSGFDSFGFGEGMLRRALRNGQAFAEKLYHAGDNVWKAAAWVSEVKKWEPILGREAAEKKAATVVRAVYPTYSEVPQAVRGLRRVPLIAPFASFPAEVIRTTKNTLQLIFGELRDERPEVRAIGAKRLAGTLAAGIGSYALASMSRGAFGVSADEDEAVRATLPEFHKNVRIWYTGRNADGTLKYVNGSKLDPNSYLLDALSAVFRNPGASGLAEGMNELVKPYAQESILGRLALDLSRNQKEPGGQVYDPSAPARVRAGQVAGRVYEAFEPGTLTAGRRLGSAVVGQIDPRTGRKASVGDELLAQVGGRVFTHDPELELENRAVAFTREIAQAGRQTNRLIGQRGPAGDEELTRAAGRTDAARAAAVKALGEVYKAAVKLGVSQDRAIEILIRKEVPREAIASIVYGEPLPAYQPPRARTEEALRRSQVVTNRPR